MAIKALNKKKIAAQKMTEKVFILCTNTVIERSPPANDEMPESIAATSSLILSCSNVGDVQHMLAGIP